MTEIADGLGDFHNHLVPGVDDGARSLEEALDGVRAMVAQGIRRIVTTPHLQASTLMDPDRGGARLDTVQEAFGTLREAVEETFESVTLASGFEVNLDMPAPDLGDPRVRLAGTRFVLVEWPRFQVPPGTERVLAGIREAGWIPVIAHPERYHGLDSGLEIPRRWRRAGAYLQVNHASVLGRYGTEARNRAVRLLQDGVVDYLSTDFHPRPGLSLGVDAVRAFFDEADAASSFQRLACINPGRLMQDEEPLPVPGFSVRKGLLSRIGTFLGSRGGPE